MYNPRVLLFILTATILAYLTHVFLKRMIDPRRSVVSFIMYIAAHLVSIITWVFIFGLVLIHYKDFFFKR
ncbi:MAG: hypothetical protein IPP96_05820 [Chitinophagaceae bacterium]|nr:hypothetical protein [Chitinophagaceae bacterium]